MYIAAHRGYSGLYPENTMLAFQKAVEAGADEIELDVQLSKDGQVVVFHDDSLERLTGDTRWVWDAPFAELCKLNVAGKHGDKFGVNPIPSLDEYLGWAKSSKIVTNIELKNRDFYFEGLEEKTIALIAKYSMEDRVFFSSFNHVSLMACKKINPRIPCGVLVHSELGNAGYYVSSNSLDFYHPDMKSLDEETVANCAHYGIGINIWTVDDMAGLLQAQAWNCRGIITNFPEVCKTWVSSNSRT